MSNVLKVKTYKKKLTNSGIGSRILMFFAMLLSAIGCALEPLSKILYSATHSGKALGNMFSEKIIDYIGNAIPSISVFIISFVLFCGLCSCSNKMKLDCFSITFSIFTGVSVMIMPVYEIVKHIMDKSFVSLIGKDFVSTCKLISFCLPALSAFLIILSGLALAGKISDDYIEVEIPLRKDLALQNQNSDITVAEKTIEQPNNMINETVYAQNNSDAANSINESNTQELDAEQINDVGSDNEKPQENISEDSQIIDEKQNENKSENAVEVSAEIPPQTDAKRVCPHCMSPLKENAKFCSSCGKKLD